MWAFVLKPERRGRIAAAFLLSAGLGLLPPDAAAAEPMQTMSAINKAGRQRMLTQRLVKAYAQIGLDVQADQAAVQIRDAIAVFDAQLAELKAFAPTPEIGRALDGLAARWQPFRAIVSRPYRLEGAQSLKETNEEVLTAAHRVVLLLQDASGVNLGRLVNISGRQRMLSQRIGKFYMLRELGFRDAEVREGLDQSMNEFKGAATELRAARENTPAIAELLRQVDLQWQLLEHSIRENKPQLAFFVATTTEKILQMMDETTRQYELLGAAR